ncbi:CPBP family intramembrane glutamic endopeptidase [Fervidobacterium thailandense]|uniref:CAAX prenyl protease 2/Lysostaphin resistance protein A-like domain-containing protein n=1 Tax=Fervidobacterium thailandense TaxID=1008305 RepID=A0A1E3G4X7_9BACT|nr:CPBP family intramembrane glutamic endopeptidase [Fervidobacterium thailandense]ODN31325.1 hypothetical protein A4H02_00720 [Fervidobacterium thailandense]
MLLVKIFILISLVGLLAFLKSKFYVIFLITSKSLYKFEILSGRITGRYSDFSPYFEYQFKMNDFFEVAFALLFIHTIFYFPLYVASKRLFASDRQHDESLLQKVTLSLLKILLLTVAVTLISRVFQLGFFKNYLTFNFSRQYLRENFLIYVLKAFDDSQVGFWEELTARKIILEGLISSIGFSRGFWLANFVFSFFHIFVAFEKSQNIIELLVVMLNYVLLSVVISTVYIRSRSVFCAGVFHAVTNFVEGVYRPIGQKFPWSMREAVVLMGNHWVLFGILIYLLHPVIEIVGERVTPSEKYSERWDIKLLS